MNLKYYVAGAAVVLTIIGCSSKNYEEKMQQYEDRIHACELRIGALESEVTKLKNPKFNSLAQDEDLSSIIRKDLSDLEKMDLGDSPELRAIREDLGNLYKEILKAIEESPQPKK